MRATTGGRAALAGFLFQILRGLKLGLSASLRIAEDGDDFAMLLKLEPPDGGDHRVEVGADVIVEQVKIRTRGSWSLPEFARAVLPNLMDAAKSSPSQYRFVTNTLAGLETLRRFLEMRNGPARRAGLDLRWRGKLVTAEQFEGYLAVEASTRPTDPNFTAVLDCLTLEMFNPVEAEVQIDRELQRLLALGESASDVRDKLIGRLFALARDGRTVTSDELLAAVCNKPQERLGLATRLPQVLVARVHSAARNIGYDPRFEARLKPVAIQSSFTLLAGEAGQGKSWQLCQAALAELSRGGLAMLVPAQSSIEALLGEVSRQLWEDMFGFAGTIAQIRDKLAPHFRNSDGSWLTLFIDDVQDRDFAASLKGRDWEGDGIRIVLSCQPRIAKIFAERPDIREVQVQNFTSSELRRFLKAHGRAAQLETMPDDVYDLLRKPIHAAIFTRLDDRKQWVPETEYELFDAYWTFAARQARNQRDHRRDRLRLIALAEQIRGDPGQYPLDLAAIEAADVDEPALLRLEQVGLVQWRDEDSLAFASDRMLNWAVAEAIAARIALVGPSPEQAERLLSIHECSVEEREVSPRRAAVKDRLGYVFLDAFWLLCGRLDASPVAQILRARIDRRPRGWAPGDKWGEHIATVGPRLIPVIEELVALDPLDTDRGLTGDLIDALVTIGRADTSAVAAAVERLLSTGHPIAERVAVGTAARLPCPNAIEAIWQAHLERNRAYRAWTGSDDIRRSRLFERTRDSGRALRRAIARDPSWIAARVQRVDDPVELEELVTALVTPGTVPAEWARGLWIECRDRLAGLLPPDSYALVLAIEYFADATLANWLDRVPHDPAKFTSARVRRARAMLDPDRALEDLASGADAVDRPLSGWWVPRLARRDPEGFAAALRARVAANATPLGEAVRHYRECPGAITPDALDWVLDEFATELDRLLSDPGGEDVFRGCWSVLDFLSGLNAPWQFELLSQRRGSALDLRLAAAASKRRGRTSRHVDREGQMCDRILAMMAGPGFEQCAIAKLQRADAFGREDGYRLVQWTASEDAAAALAATQEDVSADSYRKVVRMEALAALSCDAAIEAMIRDGTPVYVNAAAIRGAASRPNGALLSRVRQLAAHNSDRERTVAARLAAFLPEGLGKPILLPLFLAPHATRELRRAVIATFHSEGTYDPAMLCFARHLMEEGSDRDRHFVAGYLAGSGDHEARMAAAHWLEDKDLGHGSVADRSYLSVLAEHSDTKEMIVEFLRRSRANGHRSHDFWQMRLLAEDGDLGIGQEIVEEAYRKSVFGEGRRLAAIRFVASSDPDEALFFAQRMWAMERSLPALALVLEWGGREALAAALEVYREAPPRLRLGMARRLRTVVTLSLLEPELEALARSSARLDRRAAAELGGWFPPERKVPWLVRLIDDPETEVAGAAREAVDRRNRESLARDHLSAMDASPRVQKWARLSAIFELADPFLLWRRDDPMGLGDFLSDSPHEYYVEAERLRAAAEKEVERALWHKERQDE